MPKFEVCFERREVYRITRVIEAADSMAAREAAELLLEAGEICFDGEVVAGTEEVAVVSSLPPTPDVTA